MHVLHMQLLQVSTSEVTSGSHSASHFKQHSEPYVEPLPDHLHATMDVVLAKAMELSEEEKEVETVPTEPDCHLSTCGAIAPDASTEGCISPSLWWCSY